MKPDFAETKQWWDGREIFVIIHFITEGILVKQLLTQTVVNKNKGTSKKHLFDDIRCFEKDK